MDLLLNLCIESAEYDLTTRLLGCVVPKVTARSQAQSGFHRLAEQTWLGNRRRWNDQTEILVGPEAQMKGSR